MRQALILVGGRGTRLGEHARDVPKPLVPIAGDVRFLDLLIENIARHGVQEIVLLAGHLADQVERRYHGRSIRGARLRVVAEPAPAGTAGALRYVAETLDDVFLMTNGDSYFDANYLALAQRLGPADTGAMALRRVPDAARYGRVQLSDGRVTAFHEKDASFRGDALISAGVYVLRKSVLDLIGPPPCSIETDIFPKLAAQGALAGVESQGFFIDIGLPETLSEARATLPAAMRRGAVFFDRDGTLTRDDGYTHKPEDLEFLPGAIEAIRRCNDAGRFVIVVTNQSGVARGYYAEADVERFHAHMQAALAAHGAHVDAFYYCPYHADGTRADYAIADHPDRKPNPGLLRRALAEWPIEHELSFMVGDTAHDIASADALGIAGYRAEPGEVLAMVEKGMFGKSSKPAKQQPEADLQQRADLARWWLFDHALPLWWRSGFDGETGTWREKLSLEGDPVAATRRVRVQARQTIVYARAGRMGWNGPWKEAVEAGLRSLNSFAFRPDGGTRHILSESGVALDDRRDLYDFAFCLLALAEAKMALGGRDDLISAANLYLGWLDSSWRYPDGSYFEGDVTGSPPRLQNPHMHLFEALLSLYEATNDRAHLERADNIARLFKDHFFDNHFGALREYFDPNWHPLKDEKGRIVEPGHQFEWSWLLTRYHRLGGVDLSEQAERLRVHGEVRGVDPKTAAVYDEVFVDGKPKTKTSRLWPHTERLKANLVRYELTLDPGASNAAAQAFDMIMKYCQTPKTGVWRDKLKEDGKFVDEPAPASSFYHLVFALGELMRVADATR